MGGRFTSKRCSYAPPPPDQIAEFRKHYGADIYPTVKAHDALHASAATLCMATALAMTAAPLTSAPHSANRRWCAR